MASTLSIALQNQTTSSTVYAFITGQALQHNNALFLLQSDGSTYYFPTQPPSIGSPLAQNCAIPLGGPGSTITVTIPQIAGGRIWFSIGTPLTFHLNPGPALVEPSVTNPSDPNINTSWGFCELTFNSDQLYANISYVDFVGLPISLNLISNSRATQQVAGLPQNGLDTICSGLISQTASDKQPWSSLIVKDSSGHNLRVLSPNNGIVTNRSMLSGYFEPYVDRTWSKFTGSPITVNTQAGFGTISGQVSNNLLNFNGQEFTRPTTADIFSCSTGPFATGSDAERNVIIPRLAAAFNRSTLLLTDKFPAPLADYYKDPITNHYSRIVHAANLDGRGYAFPYDDVGPAGGPDQSGEVNDPSPRLLTVTVGGANAAAPSGAAVVAQREENRHAVADSSKQPTAPAQPAAQAAPKPQQKFLGRFMAKLRSFRKK
jgi:Beta-1,3-glucanase